MALDSDFRNPAWGAALYHESQLRLGRFDLSAGLRIDYERTRLRYLSSTDIDCTFGDGRITPFTERGTLHKSFVQLLPKAAADAYRMLRFGGQARNEADEYPDALPPLPTRADVEDFAVWMRKGGMLKKMPETPADVVLP